MQLIVLRKPQETGASKGFGVTRDVSAGGVYFYTHEEVAPDSEVSLIMQLPPELNAPAGAQEKWVFCQAKVVRTEPAGDGKIGVGAEIRLYQILGEG